MSGAIGDGIRVRCSDGAASYIVQITGSSNPAPSNTPYGTVTANAHYMTLTTDPTQAVAYIANRLKNDYSQCPDMWQRSISGCYQNNVAWL